MNPLAFAEVARLCGVERQLHLAVDRQHKINRVAIMFRRRPPSMEMDHRGDR